jgi:hypothetical protein
VSVETPKVPNGEHKAKLEQNVRRENKVLVVVLWFTYIDTGVRIRRENGTRPRKSGFLRYYTRTRPQSPHPSA